MRNCTRDERGPFGFGDQEPISSHRELLRRKAVVVSVAETATDKPIYEYACHEGNYALGSVLRGARRQDTEEAAAQAK
jgi:hypothetical protein